jgi:hypothetical protein
MIEGYRNSPGEHCGSVAMRSLLRHYCGLELPESAVFGLGAGLTTGYLCTPGASPAITVFGRTATLELDVAAALGVDYVERSEPDDEKAWLDVREEILAGRPTMLSGDILYLDYREYKVHFPGHRFVLLGFDDEQRAAYIADRIREEPETCSYGALFQSRNPPEGLSTFNLWGRFRGAEAKHDLHQATRIALETCTRRMLNREETPMGSFDSSVSATTGLAGTRRLAEQLPTWGERDDVNELASFNAACLEKFGNGGGNFRRLYAGFLEWARERDAALVPAAAASLAWRSADTWTRMAHLLWSVADGASPWDEAAALAREIGAIERELFEGVEAALAAGS